jgi:hypothetical protein
VLFWIVSSSADIVDLPVPVHTVPVVLFGPAMSGGTTAILVPNFDPHSIDRALDCYIETLQAMDAPVGRIGARNAAAQDLLACAELHATELLPHGRDLEDDEGLFILIEASDFALLQARGSDQSELATRPPRQLEAVRLPHHEGPPRPNEYRPEAERFWWRFTHVLADPCHPQWSGGVFTFRLMALSSMGVGIL